MDFPKFFSRTISVMLDKSSAFNVSSSVTIKEFSLIQPVLNRCCNVFFIETFPYGGSMNTMSQAARSWGFLIFKMSVFIILLRPKLMMPL